MSNKKNTLWKIARVISDIFVPPTFVLFSFILLGAEFEENPGLTWLVILNGFVFGFVLPIIFFLFMRKHNLVVNRDATIKEERTLPYFVGIILSLFGAGVCYYAGASDITTALWLAYAGNTLLLILINKFWKISAHAMGTGIPLGISLALGSGFSYFFLAALVIVFWARLTLKVHTPAQLIGGALLGSALAILIITLR